MRKLRDLLTGLQIDILRVNMNEIVLILRFFTSYLLTCFYSK